VITDIVMPEKEGLETISELRRVSQDVRIIAISGGGHISPERYLRLANSFGADRTFFKPVDLKELVAAVKELLAAPPAA
jgi:YesN/AraC family two-component response regulator